jgi:hypothetical protein
MRQRRFLNVRTQSTIKDTPTTCTTTSDEDLGWIDFASIFDFINTSVFTYEHALNKFLNLTHFLFFWFEDKKDKGTPLVEPKHMALSFWKLGLGKLEAS